MAFALNIYHRFYHLFLQLTSITDVDLMKDTCPQQRLKCTEIIAYQKQHLIGTVWHKTFNHHLFQSFKNMFV